MATIGTTKHQQMSFGGGVNASTPAHLIGDDQVQTATNLDFSVERGAARSRRGYVPYSTNTLAHYAIYRVFDTDSLDGNYYTANSTPGVGRLRISGQLPTGYTEIASVTDTSAHFMRYKNYTYIVGGNVLRKDDGTNTTEWIKQVPPAPTVTINTGGTKSIATAFSILEGTSSSTFTATVTGDPTTGRVTLLNTTAVNLATNGSFNTGTAGIIYTSIGFSDPQNVYRVSVDFAIDAITLATSTTTTTSGTTTTTTTTTYISAGFVGYWHADYLPNIGRSLTAAYPSVDALTGAAQQQDGVAVTAQQISSIQGLINADQVNPLTNIPFSPRNLGLLSIPKTNFQFVGTWTGTGDPWAAVTGVRVIVESYVTGQVVYVDKAYTAGDEGHCLTDLNVGYTWYQTFAEIDSDGNFVGESAPSDSAGPYKCINANATVTLGGTATGTIHGITHIITYRQGGYAQAPYAVSTKALATATITDTVSDITALLRNGTMAVDVMHPNEMEYFNIISSEHFYDRVYVGNNNLLRWSQIGRPDQFLSTNSAVLNDPGDVITGLVVWPPGMVIVSWRSVYEISGSVFEGPNADYTIQRAAVRRGSIAPNTIIKTPHGIPLVNWDGITMYQPGAGVDVALPWVIEQIGDAFRGQAAGDPGPAGGSRIPIINQSLTGASACYSEGKLYIATPTGASAVNDTVFVLDFNAQKCWWYQYFDGGSGTLPVNGLWWEFVNNHIIAGSTNGFHVLETAGSELGADIIRWNFKTRAWTVPNDTLVENFAVEYIGGPFEVAAVYDGTTTTTLGTVSSVAKAYAHLPMNGIIENNLVFRFTAISSATSFNEHTAVYGITWDSITHPEKVHFFQTDYEDNGWAGDKLWDELFVDIGLIAGTTTAVTFIDGVAVMTNTLAGTNTGSPGRNIYTFSFPTETYGEIAYTTYTNTDTFFKLWDHRYAARNEPPKVTIWRTTIESLDEAICDAFDVDINPNGTVLATAYVDNTVLQTNTITGTKRQSYTWKLPVEVYGRTMYVLYNSGGTNTFKHYNTWFHRRPEPDRWTNYVSERHSGQERHFDAHEVEVNPLGNTVTGTALVDGTAYGTFTYTGTLRERFVNAFPAETYGKTTWTEFHVVESDGTGFNPMGGRFKYFADNFIGTLEPDRLTFVQKILPPWPSEHYLKTWITELNPLGTCTGTMIVDGTAISTATFSGTIRESYNVGIDNPTVITLQTATAVEVRYSGTLFKHYDTRVESVPKPFGKDTWSIEYRKIGGASQIDMARFWTVDVEVPSGANVLMTSVWDIDGLPGFSTNTLTLTQGQRNYIDRIPFPPGGRGRLFQQRIKFSAPVKLWRSSLDAEHIGVKGLSRITINGTPVVTPNTEIRYSDVY